MTRLQPFLGAFLLLAACGTDPAATKTDEPAAAAAEQSAKPHADVAAAAPAAAPSGTTGEVVETMNSGGYTYVQVKSGDQTLWAAAPEFKVAVGETVVVPKGMPMQNFHSNTLNRDFEMIYFVDAVTRPGEAPAGGAAAMPPGHPAVSADDAAGAIGPQPAPVQSTGDAGTKTVEQVITGKAELAGKTVEIKGKVVKYSGGIMGHNWLHIQDGTGGDGTNDITVTSDQVAAVGDEVTLKGVVATDRDFGAGYSYSVMIEQATVAR